MVLDSYQDMQDGKGNDFAIGRAGEKSQINISYCLYLAF